MKLHHLSSQWASKLQRFSVGELLVGSDFDIACQSAGGVYVNLIIQKYKFQILYHSCCKDYVAFGCSQDS